MTRLDLLYSYIDPFSGSILLQLIIAGAIGAVAFFRKAIRNVVAKVMRRS